MEQLLCHVANLSPKSTAIVDGNQSFSYEGMIAQADNLVNILEQKSLKHEEPVCILLDAGSQQIIAQVAVLRAGGTCVPIEPSMPNVRLEDMLISVNVRLVITCQNQAHRLTKFDIIPIEEILQDRCLSEDEGDNIPLVSGCANNHRSHIIFTSGSTGKPKAVQISARSILHLASSTPVTPLTPSDRVSGFVNPGFDLSLFEIWVSLLSGATIVVIPKPVVTDPFVLGGFLKDHQVTVMIMPTGLFNIIALDAPSSFESLNHLLIAGESPNVNATKEVLTRGAPRHLWNAYGPTEATTFSTLHLVTLEETQRQCISIGEAVGETKIYLLDDNGTPIFDKGQAGEIYIAGPGVSSGYLNRPDANAERFVKIDGKKLRCGSSDPVRLYKTGDLGKWRTPSKVLDYIGRIDNQIKRSGFRVELGEIERTLETNDQVQAAVAVQRQPKTDRGSSILVANVVPSRGDNGIDPRQISNWAKERLPHYMVPDRIESIPELPLTANGKVDHNALVEKPSTSGQEQPDSTADTKPLDHNNTTLARLTSSLQELLSVPTIRKDEDIFSLGMSSLQAARWIGLIKQHFAKSLTMETLYNNQTLQKLAAVLDKATPSNHDAAERRHWQSDAKLADSVELLPDWQSDEEGHVFLTGATGFVGAHLMQRLLAMPTVKAVACLVRSRGHHTASDRIQMAMEKYDLWNCSLEQMRKIIPLDGDITNETLGLERDQYIWLSNWASVVFHVAAKVNWCEPYSSHFAPNVLGTGNILRLVAGGKRKLLHYMSSIDVWGATGLVLGTEMVREDGSLHPHIDSLAYDTGYAQSQWVSEEMVRRAQSRGLPIAIHRPGFVLGHSSNGASNPDDFFGRLVIGCIQLGLYPHLPHQRLEYVTVDYVCSAVLHIASSNRNLGRSYHIVSPDPAQSVNLEDTCRVINQTGYSVKLIPFDEWVNKLRDSEGLYKNPLQSMMPLFEEDVLRGLNRLQTSKYTPIFDASNTTEALADRPDICYSPLNPTLLRRYIDFWVRKGFYDV